VQGSGRGQAAAAAAAEAGRLYAEAMAAYSAACGLSSSEAGDDLPALLFNWGVGLHSLGTHAPVRPAGALRPAARAWPPGTLSAFSDADVVYGRSLEAACPPHTCQFSRR